MKDRLPSLISALRGRAEVYRMIGHYNESIKDFQHIISICNKTNDTGLFPYKWQAHINVANIYSREKSKFNRAKKIVESILEQMPHEEESEVHANAYTSLGLIHWNLGNYDAAKEYYRNAIRIFEKLHDEGNASRVYGSLGIIFKDKGDLDNALKYCKKDLAISKKVSNQYGISVALNNIGLIHLEKGEYKKALECQKKYLDFARKVGYKRGIALACNNIGSTYREKGDHETALHYYEESLQNAEAYNLIRVISSVSNSIGLIHLANENYASALEHIKKYLAINESIGFKMGIDIACGNIGMVYYESGDYKNALKYYERSLAIAEEIGDKMGRGIGYLGASRANLELRRYDSISTYLKKANKIFTDYGNTKKLSEVHATLSMLNSLKGNSEKGYASGKKALILAQKSGAREMEVLAQRALAKSLQRTDHKRALSHLRKAIAIAKTAKGKADLALSLRDLSDLFTIMKKPRDAQAIRKKAETLFKRLGRA